MAKIINDKYYTPAHLAEYVVNKTKEIIGEENISEYLEPSGGAGVFLDFLPVGTYSCDIEPEDDRVVKQDYLSLDLGYKKGRCVIGNPPFGNRNTLSVQFYKKSIQISDYIVFILPISQLNNNQQMYEFDLIYSEDLEKQIYTNVEVHCCLNIYKKPTNGINLKANRYKLKDITYKECRKSRNQYLPKDFNYDLGFCSWGTIFKPIEYEGQFQQEIYIKINNEKLKDEILYIINTTDWFKEYSFTKSPHIHQWQISKYLLKKIEGLK